MTFDEAARLLAEAGLESPRAEARLLYAHALGVTRDETLSAAQTPTPEQAAAFAAMVARRVAREPSAYITGHREFWSLDFKLGPGVLVPRPETETLIEEALKLVPDRSAPLRISDLGTGTGILLIAALCEFPNATGIGFESSPDAFNWGRHNAALLMPERAEIRLTDWNMAEGPFDLVFSNPPYIPLRCYQKFRPGKCPVTNRARRWTVGWTGLRPIAAWQGCCPESSSPAGMRS